MVSFFETTASDWDFWLVSKFENPVFTAFPVVSFFETTASDWHSPVLSFFETTGRANVLLAIEVGMLLAKKVLSPSLVKSPLALNGSTTLVPSFLHISFSNLSVGSKLICPI
ncbi:hypothetical protein CIRMBP1248_02352 [Enterococcus cecorum]|nr:hypothetical protein CIRMBP1248_02352 [Enterococcus cecorum]